MQFFKLCPCGSSCLEIVGDKLFYISSGKKIDLTNEEDVYSRYIELCAEDDVHIATEERLSIQQALRDHYERLETNRMIGDIINSMKDKLSKRKLYILVREDIGIGHAMNCVSHAAAAAVRKWSGDTDFELWHEHSFRKVTCKVSRGIFEESKKFEDHIVISEDVLNNTEVAIIFKPREEWPEFFRRLRLYS